MENKKLIVLGNGFDLACGLKSKYSDFFKKKFDEKIKNSLLNIARNFENQTTLRAVNLNAAQLNFDTIFDIKFKHRKRKRNYNKFISPNRIETKVQDQEALRSSNLTFWDIILFYFQEFDEQSINIEDVQWQNIEDRMLDFLTLKGESTHKPSLRDILGVINKTENITFISWICLHVASFLPEREKTYESNDFLQYLYDELRLFESTFVDYLDDEVRTNSNYRYKAIYLLEAITSDRVEMLNKHSILSFNYTKPVKKHIVAINNVHGTLDSRNIIFGIDKTGVKSSESIYRFTKTFRQMTETNISKKNGDEILPKENISEIAFFGHSLSKLDYSYFQTLFDFYDLYGSDIKLVFFYRVYSGINSIDMEQDLSTKISRLLEAYGESIDNEKKSDNLMHKLLLEKRLIIEGI